MSWVVVVPVKGNPGAKTRLGGPGPGRADLADAFALDTVAALLRAAPVVGVFVVTGDRVLGARLASIGAHIVAEGRVATGPRPADARHPLTASALVDPPAAPAAADPTEPVDPAEPADPSNPSNPADPAEPADPSNPANPADPVDPLNRAIRVGLAAAEAAFPAAHRAVVTGDLPALTPADVEQALALAAHHVRSMVPDADETGTTVLLALAGVPISPRFGPGSRAAHEARGYVPLALAARSGIRRDVDTPADLDLVERLGAGPHTSALLAAASATHHARVPRAAPLVTSPDRPLEK